MTKQKTELLTQPIIRYVTGLVIKSSQQQPELLPGEMFLCKKFNVGRGTVRRAMALLIERETVLLLPKRRGYFSNPVKSGNIRHNIGIIVASGYAAAMNGPSYACLRGAFEVFEKEITCVYFPALHSNDPEKVLEELRSQQLDAVFWIAPGNSGLDILDNFSAENFPAVSVCNPYMDLDREPCHHTWLFDFEAVGRSQAEHLLKHQCTKVFTLGPGPKTLAGLRNTYEQAGHPLPENSFLPDLKQIYTVLKTALDQDQVHAVICPGPYERYREVSEFLHQHPNGKKVRLLVENEPQGNLIRTKYNDLLYDSVPTINAYKSCFEAGRRAAKCLLHLLAGKKQKGKLIQTYF